MCLGAELTTRSSSSQSSSSTPAGRPKTTKSAATSTSRSQHKQISASESSPIVESPPSNEVTPQGYSSTSTPNQALNTPTRNAMNTTSQDSPIAEFSTSHPHPEYLPTYINHDLSNQMDGVTIMDTIPSMDTSVYDADLGYGASVVQNLMPPASPPPESYMEVKAKRPKKKRDRYPELQNETPVFGSGVRSDRDLVVRAGNTPSSMDLMNEIKFLRAELESARKQNDLLNSKLIRMAEGTAVLNQLQQYMTHMKILPSTAEHDQTLAVSKEVAINHKLRQLSPTEIANMAPFGAFRDACTRHPNLPIALFNLSLPTPVVVTSNDAFNNLFSTDSHVSKPWVHFIAPSHLERTKQLLFRAFTEHEAIRFVQVYKGPGQKQFLALDVHRFFSLYTPSGTQMMDLVFLITRPDLKYPHPDDLTFWKAPLNDQGVIILDSVAPTITGSLDAHVAETLTSSTGISFEHNGAATFHDPSSNSGFSHFGAIPSSSSSNRIDILPSPSVTEVTTPPQDPISTSSVMNASPRLSASPLDNNSWMNETGPNGEFGTNSGTWYDPNSTTWQPSDWSAMNMSGSIPIPAYGFAPSPAPSSESRIEDLTSPSSPGYAVPTTPSNTPVAPSGDAAMNVVPPTGFNGLTASGEIGGHFPTFTEDFDAL